MEDPAPEHNFNQPGLEKALRDALKSVLDKDGGPDPRTSFYKRFKEEVAEHDNDLKKKHEEDLNSTLIFAGLFSAVTSAFIIDIQSELKPDYQEMNNTLLELLLNATVGSIPPGQPIAPPRWAGPNPAIRQAQATLYATLCATLFAAFLATLGKQWLNQYSQTDTHGSNEDRCRERERKLSGIDRWRFHTIMQSASLTIQGSLALLGSALSRYLWEVDRAVSSVVIGFTSVGCAVYITIVTVSVLFFDCPFQTPVSSLFRSMIGATKSQPQARSEEGNPDQGEVAGGALSVVGVLFRPLQERLHHSLRQHYWEGYKHDARCITRMFVISSDMDTIRLTVGFVQEVVWGTTIRNAPLGWIHGKLVSCFDTSLPNAPILIPALRDIAYLSAKAFTRILIQQRYFPESNNVDENPLKDIKHTPLAFIESSGDPDLESVLLMVEKEFGCDAVIPWDKYRLSSAHHIWVSHLFVYHAKHKPLSDDVSNFVKHSLNPNKCPGAVIADCLCIINIILRNLFSVEHLARRDKSSGIDTMLREIFRRLSDNFEGSRPRPIDTDGLERSLRALELVTQLSTTAVATKSYELFETIMGSQIEQVKKMQAARLALDAAYQPGPTRAPTVGGLDHIIDFLRHHFASHVSGEDRYHAASLITRAINPTPDEQYGTWCIEDVEKILAEFWQGIERVKVQEGAAATVTLEELYGRLSGFVNGRKALHLPAPAIA